MRRHEELRNTVFVVQIGIGRVEAGRSRNSEESGEKF